MHLELHINGLGYISNYRTHTHQSSSAYVALYIRQKSNITEVDAEAAHLCFYLKRH